MTPSVGQPGLQPHQPPPAVERWRRLLRILHPDPCLSRWGRAPSAGGSGPSLQADCAERESSGQAPRLGKISGLAGSSCCSSFCCSQTNPQLGGLNGGRHQLALWARFSEKARLSHGLQPGGLFWGLEDLLPKTGCQAGDCRGLGGLRA